jgi:hypothetical protein
MYRKLFPKLFQNLTPPHQLKFLEALQYSKQDEYHLIVCWLILGNYSNQICGLFRLLEFYAF